MRDKAMVAPEKKTARTISADVTSIIVDGKWVSAA